jgi:hypothetical protein
MTEFEIDPAAADYYERTTATTALELAKEMIDEWDYAEDPAGYCHERPMLVRLVEVAEAAFAVASERGGIAYVPADPAAMHRLQGLFGAPDV